MRLEDYRGLLGYASGHTKGDLRLREALTGEMRVAGESTGLTRSQFVLGGIVSGLKPIKGIKEHGTRATCHLAKGKVSFKITRVDYDFAEYLISHDITDKESLVEALYLELSASAEVEDFMACTYASSSKVGKVPTNSIHTNAVSKVALDLIKWKDSGFIFRIDKSVYRGDRKQRSGGIESPRRGKKASSAEIVIVSWYDKHKYSYTNMEVLTKVKRICLDRYLLYDPLAMRELLFCCTHSYNIECSTRIVELLNDVNTTARIVLGVLLGVSVPVSGVDLDRYIGWLEQADFRLYYAYLERDVASQEVRILSPRGYYLATIGTVHSIRGYTYSIVKEDGKFVLLSAVGLFVAEFDSPWKAHWHMDKGGTVARLELEDTKALVDYNKAKRELSDIKIDYNNCI